MSTTGMSGVGKIRWFNDFAGAEIPVANAVAYGTTAGGCNYYLGDFKLIGDLAETDTGAVSTDKANGYILLSGNNEDGKGAAIATGVNLSPALNGTIVVEARLERAALTAGVVFVGLAGTLADDVAEPVTSTTTTITKVVPCVGFLLDSQLTASTTWHMPYILATDTTQTSTGVAASQVAVAAESDVVRLEVDNNGAARWYINGILEQSVGAGLAATTTTLMGACVGCWGTTTTAATVDVDYLLVEANRDWTR
uniref:Uncharacterized protein n=1 Tax=viral metagenome TaxID=1070528 RepID=A0A6M3LL28_9ZZZZ